MSNVRPFIGSDGKAKHLSEVIDDYHDGITGVTPEDDTDLGSYAWEREAVMARTSAYIYRALGPRNTADLLANVLGREKSTRGARSILERTRALSLPDFVKLYHTPGFGMPFAREVLGLPEDADLTRLIREIEELKASIEKL